MFTRLRNHAVVRSQLSLELVHLSFRFKYLPTFVLFVINCFIEFESKMVKLTPEDRCEILLALKDNIRHVDLALHYGVSRQAVYDVERIWKTQRRITDKPKLGPQPKYDESKIKEFVDYANSHPFATLEMIKSKYSLSYQLPRISTILRKHGLRTCVAKLKNPLTKKAKDNRIKFANDNKTLDFDRVIFLDRKTVQNFCNGKVRVRRLRGQGYVEKNMVTMDQKRSCKGNLWGYISKEKCELFKIDTKFKSPAYLKLANKFCARNRKSKI